MRHLMTILAILCTGLLISCNGEETPDNDETARGGDQALTLYVSADDYLAREVVDAFKAETGITVNFVGDTEANKTTGLVNRLRAEADNPRADVFWSSEVFMTIQLAEEGILAPIEPELPHDWPQRLIGDDNLWYGFGDRARVIVYSPDRMAEQDVPKRWIDLVDPQWNNRIVMADPRFGTTRGHMGAMLAWWRHHPADGNFDDFLTGLADNNVRLLTSGNAGVVRAVAAGEADLGLTDTDDVWAAQRNGYNVALVYPAHGRITPEGQPATGEGTLLIPNTIALTRGARNPDAAKLFIEFILSERVQRIMVESDSHNIPVSDALADEFSEYAVPHPLNISFEAAADEMDHAVDRAMETLR